MRETLDCAVVITPGMESWTHTWIETNAPQMGRIRLHAYVLLDEALSLRETTADNGTLNVAHMQLAAEAFAKSALLLRRFDACLVPVAPVALVWARMALAQGRQGLAIPLIALLQDIKALAIQDLFNLGMNDFVRLPMCPEELKARLNRLITVSRHAARLSETGPASHIVNEPGLAYGGLATTRPRVSPVQIKRELLELQTSSHATPDESFGKAKNRIVTGFEQEFVRAALARHGGNVAQAARASSKHRRAFWALMRKHRIDAAPYRTCSARARAQSLS